MRFIVEFVDLGERNPNLEARIVIKVKVFILKNEWFLFKI